jgi:transcriptional regulator with XRE-family HTH domain
MKIEKKFAMTIQRMRLSHPEKLTQQDVADYAGISLRYYCDLEKGNKNPTLRVIQAIAEAYEMQAHELLELMENV